jgi:hypothetical protein
MPLWQYSWHLFTSAHSDAFKHVMAGSLSMTTILTWIVIFLLLHVKRGYEVRREIWRAVISTVVVIMLYTIAFLAYFLFLTPKRFYDEHERRIADFKATPAPVPNQTIQVVPVDPEARKQIEDLRREFAEEIKNANPLKARVATVSASVQLSVSPEVAKTFTGKKWHSGRENPPIFAHLNFAKITDLVVKDGMLLNHGRVLMLDAHKMEQWGNETLGTKYFMEFQWPLAFGPITLKESVGDLYDNLNVVDMDTIFLPEGSEIREGTITLSLNGTSPKTFQIPKLTTTMAGIYLIFRPEGEPIVVGLKEVKAQNAEASPH